VTDFNDASGLLYTNDVTYRTVPLFLLTVGEDGKASVDKSAVLTERERSIAIDTSKPFKLNADTNGVCECTCGVLIYRIEDTDVYRSRAIYTGKAGQNRE
jgi:hypothetical protein